MSRTLPGHFARFALIGALGTTVHFAVLVVGVKLLGAGPVLSSQLGALAGALVNYLLNRRLNYDSQASHLFTGPRFFLVAAVGFVLNGLFMGLFVDRWSWNYLLAQCVTTSLVLLWNFAANHLWTFAGGR